MANTYDNDVVPIPPEDETEPEDDQPTTRKATPTKLSPKK